MGGQDMGAALPVGAERGAGQNPDPFGEFIPRLGEIGAVYTGGDIPGQPEAGGELAAAKREHPGLVMQEQVLDERALVFEKPILARVGIAHRFDHRMRGQRQRRREMKSGLRLDLGEELVVLVAEIVGIVVPVVLNLDRRRSLEAGRDLRRGEICKRDGRGREADHAQEFVDLSR
jgi:hypothetical protein